MRYYHSIVWAASLAAVLLVSLTLVTSKSKPIPPKTDRSENFAQRFVTPPVVTVRTIPITKPVQVAEAVPLPLVRPVIEEPSVPPQRARRSTDVCERHNLRKVFINGGRSWRCRR